MQNKRVVLPAVERRAVHALRRMVLMFMADHRTTQPLSNSERLAFQMLRSMRPAHTGDVAGKRVAEIRGERRGLVVRYMSADAGAVCVQELEPAGAGMRPIPERALRIERDEIERLARTLAYLAGLRIADPGDVPAAQCEYAAVGLSCNGRRGDPSKWAAHVRSATAELQADAASFAEELLSPSRTEQAP